jgi:hypothetical protein
MHSGAVILEDRLGHERDRLTMTASHILDDVFVLHHVVGHLGKRIEAQVNLRLAGSSHFVVVDLNGHP